MKALIVDDEPIARQVLREHLEDFADVAVIGEADTGNAALEQIELLKPDVAFLDMEMPDLHGLSVVRALSGTRAPLVIFVTAYQEHALAAFEVGAVDYLMKPVRQERLAAALDKTRQRLAARAPREEYAAGPRKIIGRVGADLYVLDPGEIVAFQAEGDTVYILTASRRYESAYPLKTLEQKLSSPPFRRIHRQTIVNADHIRRISPLTSKRWLLKMSNGMEAIVSKRMAGIFREETRW
jgi:DNA-binding LytR/AlgR family response regulator